MKVTCFDDEILERIDALNDKVKRNLAYSMRIRNARVINFSESPEFFTQASIVYLKPAQVYEPYNWNQ